MIRIILKKCCQKGRFVFTIITICHFQAAYDKICEAKKREAKRDRELDERRKKFKLGESLTLKASPVCLLKRLFYFLAHQKKIC